MDQHKQQICKTCVRLGGTLFPPILVKEGKKFDRSGKDTTDADQ